MVPLKTTEAWLSEVEKVGQESCQAEILNQEIRKWLSLLVVFSFYQVLVVTNEPDLVSHLCFRTLQEERLPERPGRVACIRV